VTLTVVFLRTITCTQVVLQLFKIRLTIIQGDFQHKTIHFLSPKILEYPSSLNKEKKTDNRWMMHKSIFLI